MGGPGSGNPNGGAHPAREMIRAAATLSENVKRKLESAIAGDPYVNVDVTMQVRKGVVTSFTWTLRHNTVDP